MCHHHSINIKRNITNICYTIHYPLQPAHPPLRAEQGPCLVAGVVVTMDDSSFTTKTKIHGLATAVCTRHVRAGAEVRSIVRTASSPTGHQVVERLRPTTPPMLPLKNIPFFGDPEVCFEMSGGLNRVYPMRLWPKSGNFLLQ